MLDRVWVSESVPSATDRQADKKRKKRDRPVKGLSLLWESKAEHVQLFLFLREERRALVDAFETGVAVTFVCIRELDIAQQADRVCAAEKFLTELREAGRAQTLT